MSKHMNSPLDHRTIRRQLLITVSAVALMGWSAQSAKAADTDHPLLWMELGGQAEAISGQGQPFTAPFMTTYAASPVFDPVSPLRAQRPPRYSFGGEAAISLQPEDSNWIFSASVRYGRSSNHRNVHQQTTGIPVPTTSGLYKFFAYYGTYVTKLTYSESYDEYKTHHSESHTVLDFQAGKDVGLGMLGTSVFSAGVRVARFKSSATVAIKARPDESLSFNSKYPKYYHTFHHYNLAGSSERSFHGIGPSVSWSGSMPLAGNPNEGELALDWGINAAVLFGQQKAKIHHDSAGYYNVGKYPTSTLYHHSANSERSRSVTVPNVGGFAGISYQFVDAKLSLGYRADYFLGAMDGGIDTAKKTTLSFNGPYASISIGMGD